MAIFFVLLFVVLYPFENFVTREWQLAVCWFSMVQGWLPELEVQFG